MKFKEMNGKAHAVMNISCEAREGKLVSGALESRLHSFCSKTETGVKGYAAGCGKGISFSAL